MLCKPIKFSRIATMNNSPQLLTTNYSFSESELSAACLDGDIYKIGAAYSPVDVLQNPALRTASISSLIPADFAFMGKTAAWIYGWTTQLDVPLHAGRFSEKRVRYYPEQGIYLSDVLIPDQDVKKYMHGAVTTDVRSVFDLVRSPDPNAQEMAWSAALIDVEVPNKALAMLKTSPSRTKGRAQGINILETVLAAVELYDDVTR